jgi:hypothetical protein
VSFYPHDFEGRIERFGVGRDRKVWYKVLFLPERFEAVPPFDRLATVRVDGEMADVPVAGAWMPTGDGRRWFIVSPHVLRTAEIKLGSVVEMRFRIDDQNRVDVPDALAAALANDADARAAWDALTPGKRRGLAHGVKAAKSPETIRKRVDALLVYLKLVKE